ncbi:hypothetical protein EMCRGX_G031852 [Ephydatia muelleri]
MPLEKTREGQSTRPSVRRDPELYAGLSGPSYSIRGVNEKFKLPSTKTLQPGVDQESGQLDSWPARPIKPASSFPPRNASTAPHPSVHRSRSAKIPDRMPVHQEVFQYLIEDFKTYKPLLSAIKNEYELFIAHEQQVIKQLEPHKARLEAVKEECERRIAALRENDKNEEAGVWMENRKLQAVIDQMRGTELSYKAQIEKLQEELGHLYEQYRDEADARKLLIADYNDLKYRHQQEQQVSEDTHTNEREDPVLLKLKLARTKEDLRAANQRINTMLADYGDVVPRRELEMLETSCKNLETELEVVKNDRTALMGEHSVLQALYKQVVNERDMLSQEMNQLKRSATPRPQWDRCAQYIDGGQDKWNELSNGKNSDQMVDVLLAEIAGVSIDELIKSDAFDGKATTGQVRNRRIGRSEVYRLINGFWQYRTGSTGDIQPLDECLFSYLVSINNGDEAMAIEEGYNLEDACTRLDYEPPIHLFHQIISGEVDEKLFRYWMELQATLTAAIEQESQKGLVTPTVLGQVLQAILPSKPSDHIKALLGVASQTASSQGDLSHLLKPNSDGQPSNFALCLLEQTRQECNSFVQQIASALNNKSQISIAELKQVVLTLDPTKPTEELTGLLSRGFAVTPQQISDEASEVTTTVSKLLQRLNTGHVLRSGP